MIAAGLLDASAELPLVAMPTAPPLIVLTLATLLAGCAAGPDYRRPRIDPPTAYKEDGAWKTAEPLAVDSGPRWWAGFHDATLDGLMRDAERANQNLRQAEAQVRQALAIAAGTRAGLWPSVGVAAGVQRGRTNTNGVKPGNEFSVGASASWEPDLWGSVRRGVESSDAGAQASADDLAAARLSIQAALAQDYLQLRITDQLSVLYAATTDAYARSRKLTQAQHDAGVAPLSDVALAESQLATAQAQAADLQAQRSQLEHAIALLTGRAPADFALPPDPASLPADAPLPPAPVGVPSQLLEHRPDVAASERRVALANASIGVARAAYFPSLVLGASGGTSAATLGTLFDTPSRVWSLGATLAQTLFDGGLRSARTAQAVASYDAAVAAYKQTVLGGFQQVEDNLALLRVLEQEAGLQAQAVKAAALAERLALSQYRAGTASFLNVVTAQALSLESRRAAVLLRGRQLAASVNLITATGGGWHDDLQARDFQTYRESTTAWQRPQS